MKSLLYTLLALSVVSCGSRETSSPPATTSSATPQAKSDSAISYKTNPEHFIKAEPYRAPFNISNPKTAQEHLNVAINADNQKDWNKAIAEYEKALALKPDWALAHYRIATDYKLIGRTDDAIAHWEQATKYDKQFYPAYNRLASIYRSQGKLQKAIDNYTPLLAYPPATLGAHYELGFAYAQLGQRQKAREHLESYRQLALKTAEKNSPRFERATNRLKQLEQ